MLEALLGRGFSVEVATPALADEGLYADELAYIARSVPRRRAEFATARVSARRALARLGVAPCSLVPLADRSPRWPPGVVGSISHTHGCCAVAVSVFPEIAGVGLDVEVDSPLAPELLSTVCTRGERAWLEGRGPQERGRLSKLIFSAKEAVYKCWYPTIGVSLAFDEVELAVDVERARFALSAVAHASAPRLEPLAGAFATPSGFIVSTAVLTR